MHAEVLDFNSICRTCLAVEGGLASIYDTKGFSEGTGAVSDMLTDLTNASPKMTDGMPENVCVDCLIEINRCYSFIAKCNDSDRKLRLLLNVVEEPLVKEEETETETLPDIHNEDMKAQELNADLSSKELNEEIKVKSEPLTYPEEEDQKEQHESSNVEYYSIEVVEETTENEKEKKKHKHRCPRCDAGFAMQRSLIAHINSNKCTVKQYSCVNCKKAFISMHKLQEHHDTCPQAVDNEGTDDESEEPPCKSKNKCSTCKKVFKTLQTLQDHIRIHTGEKPFLCSFCGRGFNQKPNMKQHEMRHNNYKPFKCELCLRSFVSKGELDAHVRSHKGIRPFACDICPASFTSSSPLTQHKRIHTGELPHGCEFCPMRFTALNTLKNHRKSHTGEKPHKCKFCDRGFARNNDCILHMRSKICRRRYICHICGAAFNRVASRRVHIQSHNRAKAETEANEQKSARLYS